MGMRTQLKFLNEPVLAAGIKSKHELREGGGRLF